VVGHNENVELETQLAEVKAELKSRKEEARLMIEEMETMGRELARRKLALSSYDVHSSGSCQSHLCQDTRMSRFK
jgi:hypothetical protein